MMTVAMMAQGMTDSQVAQFIQREMKAGATQSQIVTKLMQRGVKIDQIRRVRNQYEKQQQSRTSANYDETSPESRLRKNQQEQDNAYTSKGYQQELEARNGKQVLSGMDSLYRRSLNPDDELYYLEDSLKTLCCLSSYAARLCPIHSRGRSTS